MSDLVKIRNILVSVTDKKGVAPFLQTLKEITPDLQIIASGTTAKTLEEAGIEILPLSQYTQFPECFGGRVKTLHPKIEGGILYKRGVHDHEAEELGIPPIDMVICNLYDFESAAQDPSIETAQLIEKMDIGGSTLLRGATKNFASVAVVCDPKDYPALAEELRQTEGRLTLGTRARLATKAINVSADYDSLIAQEFSRRLTGEITLRPKLVKGRQLRYGENPDQEAWIYELEEEGGIAKAKLLNGKPLSYNNYEDATIAYQAVVELFRLHSQPGVAVIKHGGLCGFASAPDLTAAFQSAWAGDSKSAFGSVIAITHEVEGSFAQVLEGKFIEVIIAPAFSPEFLAWAGEKRPNLRLLQLPLTGFSKRLFKKISGGMLVQTPKPGQTPQHLAQLVRQAGPGEKIGVVTQTSPDQGSSPLIGFSLVAVRFAKSNAVVLSRSPSPDHYEVVSIGAGQPSRVDSLQRLAIPKANENLEKEGGDVSQCLLTSDGFFPFADSVEFAASAGISCIVQPGGSLRDAEVIKAADEAGISMIFTGERYFTH